MLICHQHRRLLVGLPGPKISEVGTCHVFDFTIIIIPPKMLFSRDTEYGVCLFVVSQSTFAGWCNLLSGVMYPFSRPTGAAYTNLAIPDSECDLWLFEKYAIYYRFSFLYYVPFVLVRSLSTKQLFLR